MDEQPVQKPFEPSKPALPQEPKKARPWAWISIIAVLVIALVASVFTNGFGITGGFVTLDPNAAANKAISFINSNVLKSQGMTAQLINTSESHGLYLVNIAISGQKTYIYVSKDGNMFFQPGAEIDMSAAVSPSGSNQQTSFSPPKTDKPTVQMFVMSFCPYGKQAEEGIGPAMAILGKDVNFEPHFIVSMSGDTVNSLHGPNEAAEDMRQVVIWKYWPEKFWKYVDYVNANTTVNSISTAWKDAAKAAGLDSTQIESKVASEGLTLIKDEAALAQSLGVSSSPTILVNGGPYNGDRTAEAFKTAFCSAFNTEPNACTQALNNQAGAASGGCTTP